jgi:hypothetical protein
MAQAADYQAAERRLSDALALRSSTAARVRSASHCKTAFAAHRETARILSRIEGFQTMPDEAVKQALAERVEKVLGMIALMINDAEADTADMQDLLDLVSAMDDDFFATAAVSGPAREKKKRMMFIYYREFFSTALKATREIEEI